MRIAERISCRSVMKVEFIIAGMLAEQGAYCHAMLSAWRTTDQDGG